jgi:hypothetical protein
MSTADKKDGKIQNSYSVKVWYENIKINIKTSNEATMLLKKKQQHKPMW